ncbi:MAG: TPR end-of-group domain-containing protein [Thermoanaerobaculia bacterium]
MKAALVLLLLAAQAPAHSPGAPAAPALPRGQVVEKVVCAANPKESYALYLPSGYTPDHAWPILYVLDPRSRGTLATERFRPGAEKHGYILASSNNTLSDTAIDPNVEAMRAMWTDTHGRLAIDDRRVYAAGFSGTVRSCCTLARAVPGTLAGIIGAGAGFPFHEPPRKGDPFVFFGTLGDKDFNYYEVMELEPRLREAGITHRVEIFDGIHQWPPEELATRALGWMEIQAMKAGTRPKDQAAIEELWSQTLARARAAETAGDLFTAHRYYSGAAEDFAGLRPASEIAEPAAKAAALAANPALRREWKEREARLKRDRELLEKAPGILAAVNPSGEPMTVAQVVAALKVPELHARAKSAPEADERLSAQRVLNTIGVQTSYYLPQAFSEKKQWDRAIFVLSVAAEVAPESPSVWFSRAEAYARKGDRKRALADLQQAIDKGWKDLPSLQRSEAFAPLRQDPEYQRLTAALEPRKPNP